MKHRLSIIVVGISLVGLVPLNGYSAGECAPHCLQRVLAVTIDRALVDATRCPDASVSLTDFDALGAGGLVVDLIGALQAAYEKLSQTEKALEEFGRKIEKQQQELEGLEKRNNELHNRIQTMEQNHVSGE